MYDYEKFWRKLMRHKVLAAVAMTLILVTGAWAGTETLLYSFNAYSGDGYYPYAGLVSDAKGNLYGTTYSGSGSASLGTVFELKLSGGKYTEVLLHTFSGGATDGEYPQYVPLVFDKTGNLYGVTYYGGTSNAGTVFELSFAGGTWTEKLLHSFVAYPNDGAYPLGALSFDADGNLYGTTYQGGSHNYGSVFQMKPAKGKWTYKMIHSFAAGKSGANPYGSGLLVGKNGYFYGTTYYGGPTYNAGLVYRLFLARGSWVSQTVYVFSGGASGANPDSGLTMDAAGNLFGTTYAGGSTNIGTVYELKAGKNNKFTASVIHSFVGGTNDGTYPYYGAGLAIDAKGNLYGTTYQGGTGNVGTIFEMKLAGGKYKESVLHPFATTNDGYYPRGGINLVKGSLFGTTYAGGAQSAGTVFEYKP
jgi:uncharacterized repeat protein (TIGR03803 family)